MTGRRKRTLSLTERELWSKVVESVTPLVARKPEEPQVAPASLETSPPPGPPPPPGKMPKRAKTLPSPPPPKPQIPAPPPLAPLEPKLRRRISRGVVAVDARIDLHGLRQDEAHRRLGAFLAGAQASGFKVVLVITGKGRPGPAEGDLFGPERGVLRRSVPIWLSSPAARGLVVGFETAQIHHGGSGALYVRIRRGGVWR